jgi:FtsH-binding integral membrane protein
MCVFSTPFLWMVWTWVSAVTFCGYILHDTSRIVLKDETDEYVIACLDLYLDFLNLFLDALRILDYLDG